MCENRCQGQSNGREVSPTKGIDEVHSLRFPQVFALATWALSAGEGFFDELHMLPL